MSRHEQLSRPPESATPMRLERAGLLEVVADAERERVEQLLAELARAGVRAARAAGQEEAAVRRRPGSASALAPRGRLASTAHARDAAALGGERLAGRRARWCSRCAGGACDRDRPRSRAKPSRKRGASSTGRPFWATKPPPSKMRPSLRADQVRVGDRALVVGRARRDHLAARRRSTPRRNGEAERFTHELGARVAAPAHRAVGRPDVLADLERDRAEVEVEDEVAERHAARPSSTRPGAPRAKVRAS